MIKIMMEMMMMMMMMMMQLTRIINQLPCLVSLTIRPQLRDTIPLCTQKKEMSFDKKKSKSKPIINILLLWGQGVVN
jgi:hypothetical protein